MTTPGGQVPAARYVPLATQTTVAVIDLAVPDPWKLAATARYAISEYGRHRAESMAAALRSDYPAQVAAQVAYRQAMQTARDAVAELARRAALAGDPGHPPDAEGQTGDDR